MRTRLPLLLVAPCALALVAGLFAAWLTAYGIGFGDQGPDPDAGLTILIATIALTLVLGAASFTCFRFDHARRSGGRPVGKIGPAVGAIVVAWSLAVPALGHEDAAALRLRPPIAVAGEQVRVSGSGFTPLEAIDVYVGTEEVARVEADGAGRFIDLQVDVPESSPPVPRWVTAVGQDSGRSVQVELRVAGVGTWPMERVDAGRTGFADGTLLDADAARRLEPIWVRPAVDPCLGSDIPLVSVEGSIFGGCRLGSMEDMSMQTLLWARSIPDGRLRWSRLLSGHGGIAAQGGVIYAGLTDYSRGRVTALDVADGSLVWRSGVLGSLGMPFTPVPRGRLLYAPSGALVALDVTDGSVRWSAPRVADGECVCDGAVAIDRELAITAGSGRVAGLDAATGAVRWVTPELADLPWSHANSLPASVSGGIAYAMVFGGSDRGPRSHLLALDVADGSIVWDMQDVGGWGTEVTVAPDVLLVPSSRWKEAPAIDGYRSNVWELRALDDRNGGDLWATRRPFASGFDIGPPVVSGDVVMLPLDSSLLFLRLDDGRAVNELPGERFGSPIVVGGIVYAVDGSGALHAFGVGPDPAPDPQALVPDPALQPSPGPTPSASLPPPSDEAAPSRSVPPIPWVVAGGMTLAAVLAATAIVRRRSSRRALPERAP